MPVIGSKMYDVLKEKESLMKYGVPLYANCGRSSQKSSELNASQFFFFANSLPNFENLSVLQKAIYWKACNECNSFKGILFVERNSRMNSVCSYLEGIYFISPIIKGEIWAQSKEGDEGVLKWIRPELKNVKLPLSDWIVNKIESKENLAHAFIKNAEQSITFQKQIEALSTRISDLELLYKLSKEKLEIMTDEIQLNLDEEKSKVDEELFEEGANKFNSDIVQSKVDEELSEESANKFNYGIAQSNAEERKPKVPFPGFVFDDLYF